MCMQEEQARRAAVQRQHDSMMAEGVEGTFDGDDARSSDSSGTTRRDLHCPVLPGQLSTKSLQAWLELRSGCFSACLK